MAIVPQKIRPCLWFAHEAEDAANFYVSIFPNSRIRHLARCSDAGPGAPGSVLVADFVLDGVEMLALNGGARFPFSWAISMSVDCADQGEVDHYWDRLGAGGTYEQCGWLKDRYGLSWQIVPRRMPEFIGGSDPAGAARAMNAMRGMVKLDIAAIEAAYRG